MLLMLLIVLLAGLLLPAAAGKRESDECQLHRARLPWKFSVFQVYIFIKYIVPTLRVYVHI